MGKGKKMRLWTMMAVLAVAAVCGCVTVRDGGDAFVRAPAGVAMVRGADFDAALEGGRVSWWVRCANRDTARAYYLMTMQVGTVDGRGIQVDASWTLESGETARIEGTGTVNGVGPGDRVERVGCVLIPGAGCETPTTRVKGNWPRQEMQATYSVRRQAEMVRVVPAPDLTIGIDGIEIDEKGGKSFEWHVTAKNNEDRPIELHVRGSFVTDQGERLMPGEVVFHLGAGQERRIEGGTVRAKAFRSVDGRADVVSKTYPKE